MKFQDGIRHLKSLGLAAVMPGGKLHPLSRKIRKPRGFIPVVVVKDGAMPKKLGAMIRRSRAEYRKALSKRNAD